jgi:tyrosine-protein phosphatase YwqE
VAIRPREGSQGIRPIIARPKRNTSIENIAM